MDCAGKALSACTGAVGRRAELVNYDVSATSHVAETVSPKNQTMWSFGPNQVGIRRSTNRSATAQ